MLLPLRQNAATKPQRSGRTQSNTPTLCPCGRSPRQNAALRRLQPHSGAAAFQGVIGESKEGLGGTRNPPGPPWPPEAATRLLTQPNAAQGRAAKAARQRNNSEQHINPLPLRQSAAPERSAPPPPTPQRSGGGTKGYPRIQGGPRGKSQSPYPSLAAGGCHKAAPQP